MSDTTTKKPMTIDNVERQRRYVQRQKSKSTVLGVVFADAFLRGMRDIGYKSPATAMAELIDNSFQAGASTVAIRFGFKPDNRGKAKPDMIAVCDDGNGMIPEMMGLAVRWGGTDREDDRTGFGRYGYGLPSAAVSLAARYTVYSKTLGDRWHAVTVDIEELAAAASDKDQTEALLTARAAELPAWILANGDLNVGKLESGTVVVLEELDRLRKLPGWIRKSTLETKLKQTLGVTYRHLLPERQILVGGEPVQAVDPLFLMEHGRFYDETTIRAERVEARTFEFETERGKGTVSIRAALLPPNFQLADPSLYGIRGAKMNKRWDIMKDYNGLLICRAKRQIDVIAPDWTKFQNYDANVKIEIDFDPELDEHFGVTTSKQQITIDEALDQKLGQRGANCGGLRDLVKDIRKRLDILRAELAAERQNKEDTADEAPERPSTVAMRESEKFKPATAEPSPAQQREAERNLEEEADKRAEVTKEPKQRARQKVEEETKAKRWAVQFASVTEGPFYRPRRLGEQKQLVINTDHPFYTKLYEPAAPDVRGGLEVLLFVLAERELEAQGATETFYKAERHNWSERLRHALEILKSDQSVADAASSVAEAMYQAVEEEADQDGEPVVEA